MLICERLETVNQDQTGLKRTVTVTVVLWSKPVVLNCWVTEPFSLGHELSQGNISFKIPFFFLWRHWNTQCYDCYWVVWHWYQHNEVYLGFLQLQFEEHLIFHFKFWHVILVGYHCPVPQQIRTTDLNQSKMNFFITS